MSGTSDLQPFKYIFFYENWSDEIRLPDSYIFPPLVTIHSCIIILIHHLSHYSFVFHTH